MPNEPNCMWKGAAEINHRRAEIGIDGVDHFLNSKRALVEKPAMIQSKAEGGRGNVELIAEAGESCCCGPIWLALS